MNTVVDASSAGADVLLPDPAAPGLDDVADAATDLLDAPTVLPLREPARPQRPAPRRPLVDLPGRDDHGPAADEESDAAPARRRPGLAPAIVARTRAALAHRAVRIGVLPVTAYVLVSVVANRHAFTGGLSTSVPQPVAQSMYDPVQQIWFLAQAPYAVLHGHSPFFTNLLGTPHGANLMDNTSMVLPALLMAPVTLAFGPVVTFNLLLCLGLAGSATSAYFVLRRYVRRDAAAFFGGLLYGCSPYMVGQAMSHIFLILVMIPPVLLLLVDEIVIRQRRSPVKLGLLFGVLCAAQLLISAEVLTSSLLLVGLGLIVLALARPHEIRARLGYLATAALVAAAAFALLAGYPVWMLQFGPQHLSGTVHPADTMAGLSSDAASTVAPTFLQVAAPTYMKSIGDSLNASSWAPNSAIPYLAEDFSYLGIVLLGFLILFAAKLWRLAVVRLATVMGLIALVLSLGPRLRIYGHVTHIPMPFDLIDKLPVLQQLTPDRLSLYTALLAALLLAVGLDHLAADGLGLRYLRTARRAGLGALAVGAVVALSLLPSWPISVSEHTTPTFFASADQARNIPAGATVLTYPFMDRNNPFAMRWQAIDGDRYRLAGYWVAVPGPGGQSQPTDDTSEIARILDLAWRTPDPRFQPNRAVLDRARAEIRQWGVNDIVVTPLGKDPAMARTLFTDALGTPPRVIGGSDVWTHVQGRLASSSASPGRAT